MTNILNARFDSDEEDDEYVPPQKNSSSLELHHKEDAFSIIKNRKRKREAEAIWEQMQLEEANAYPRAKKLHESDKNISANSKMKKNVEEEKKLDEKLDKKIISEKSLSNLEMEAMEAVKALREKKPRLIEEKVHFAGKTYKFQKEETTKDKIQEQKKAKLQVKGSHSVLDELVSQISKPKNISAVSKSKIDWNQYTEKNGLTSQLEQNRKDGYIAKKAFIQKSNENEKENSKIKRDKR